MEKKIDWEKIARLLESDSPQADALLPHEQEAFAESLRLWKEARELGAKTTASQPNMAKAKEAMRQRIAALPTADDPHIQLRPKKQQRWPYWAAAASLLLPLLFYFAWPKAIEQSVTATTTQGTETVTELPDGSSVRLGAGSFRYYFSKEQQVRMVDLEGVAHFEVAKHSDYPFVVNMAHAQVKVLGTVFELATDPQYTLLQVKEGVVALQPKQQPAWRVIARQGDQVSFEVPQTQLTKKWGEQHHISLTPGKVSFDAPLTELAQFASDWEDLEVVFENDALRELNVVITQPIACDNAIELLQKAMLPISNEVSMQIEGKRIRFAPKS